MNIYIHIPFCNQKCSYCKFALTPIFDDFKKKKYLHFLEKEIITSLEKYPNEIINTIYFGGGTPSILSPEEIENILKIFPKWKKEISFEANPEDISEKYLEKIISLGINRISIGIQSLNNQTLEAVERKNSESIFSALESIKNFEVWKVWKSILRKLDNFSINIDLILGLPFVKKWEILENIKFLHKQYPFITHTSVYILEKWKYPQNWQKNSISDAEIYEDYIEICKYFEWKNWNHYEVSNWAKPWFECKHNLWYWTHTNTIGFWLSASSFYNNLRWTNSPSFSHYYKWQRIEEETLTEEQIEIEKFLFGIRTDGYSFTEKSNFLNISKIEDFLDKWLLCRNTEKFKISEQWILLIDYIIEKILK